MQIFLSSDTIKAQQGLQRVDSSDLFQVKKNIIDVMKEIVYLIAYKGSNDLLIYIYIVETILYGK